MEVVKPFTVLNGARGKQIQVDLKNSDVYSGTLESFDVHLNLVLNDTTLSNGQKSDEKVGTVLIRGDAITIIKNL